MQTENLINNVNDLIANLEKMTGNNQIKLFIKLSGKLQSIITNHGEFAIVARQVKNKAITCLIDKLGDDFISSFTNVNDLANIMQMTSAYGGTILVQFFHRKLADLVTNYNDLKTLISASHPESHFFIIMQMEWKLRDIVTSSNEIVELLSMTSPIAHAKIVNFLGEKLYGLIDNPAALNAALKACNTDSEQLHILKRVKEITPSVFVSLNSEQMRELFSITNSECCAFVIDTVGGKLAEVINDTDDYTKFLACSKSVEQGRNVIKLLDTKLSGLITNSDMLIQTLGKCEDEKRVFSIIQDKLSSFMSNADDLARLLSVSKVENHPIIFRQFTATDLSADNNTFKSLKIIAQCGKEDGHAVKVFDQLGDTLIKIINEKSQLYAILENLTKYTLKCHERMMTLTPGDNTGSKKMKEYEGFIQLINEIIPDNANLKTTFLRIINNCYRFELESDKKAHPSFMSLFATYGQIFIDRTRQIKISHQLEDVLAGKNDLHKLGFDKPTETLINDVDAAFIFIIDQIKTDQKAALVNRK